MKHVHPVTCPACGMTNDIEFGEHTPPVPVDMNTPETVSMMARAVRKQADTIAAMGDQIITLSKS